MTIRVKCESCDSKLKIKDKFAGKKVKCPACSGIVRVPHELSADPSTEDSASTVRELSSTAEQPPIKEQPPAVATVPSIEPQAAIEPVSDDNLPPDDERPAVDDVHGTPAANLPQETQTTVPAPSDFDNPPPDVVPPPSGNLRRDHRNSELRRFYDSLQISPAVIHTCDTCGILSYTETGGVAGSLQTLATIQNSPQAITDFLEIIKSTLGPQYAPQQNSGVDFVLTLLDKFKLSQPDDSDRWLCPACRNQPLSGTSSFQP